MGWQDAPIVDAPAAAPAWQSAPEVPPQGGLPVITDDGSNWAAPKSQYQPGIIQGIKDAWNSPDYLTPQIPGAIAGAAKGLWNGIKSAVTLPGDVAYSVPGADASHILGAKVDLSDPLQAVNNAGRAFNAATMFTPGDMMAPGLTGRMTQNIKMPTRGELKTAESGAYKAAEDTGTAYDPGAVAGMLRQAGTQPGFPVPEAAPLTFGLVKDLANGTQSDGIQNIIPVNRLETLRQDLGGVTEGRDGYAAGRIKSALDDFLENPPAGSAVAGDGSAVAGLYSTARANSAARIRADQLADALQGAVRRNSTAASGNNEANSIRQRVRSFVDQNNQLTGYGEDEYRIPGYTSDQNDAIKSVLEGTPTQNAARSIGNFFGKGGGLGRLGATAVSAGAMAHVLGPETGGVIGAMIPTAIGTGARAIDDSIAKQGVNNLIGSMIQRSPMYQARAASTPFTLPTNGSGNALVRALMAQQGQQQQP